MLNRCEIWHGESTHGGDNLDRFQENLSCTITSAKTRCCQVSVCCGFYHFYIQSWERGREQKSTIIKTRKNKWTGRRNRERRWKYHVYTHIHTRACTCTHTLVISNEMNGGALLEAAVHFAYLNHMTIRNLLVRVSVFEPGLLWLIPFSLKSQYNHPLKLVREWKIFSMYSTPAGWEQWWALCVCVWGGPGGGHRGQNSSGTTAATCLLTWATAGAKMSGIGLTRLPLCSERSKIKYGMAGAVGNQCQGKRSPTQPSAGLPLDRTLDAKKIYLHLQKGIYLS